MSLVGFSAKNHPQQVDRGGALDAIDDRRTPSDLFAALQAEFRFTVDVAASEVNALLPRFFTKEQDGCEQTWFGERVWCNPPYSGIGRWVQKAWYAMTVEGAESVVMLLPANRTEQNWWQEQVEPWRDGKVVEGVTLRVRFLAGRLRFQRPEWTPGPKGDRPPFGCCLLIFTRIP